MDFWGPSGQPPLLKQGHPALVAQDQVQTAFEDLIKDLQGERPTTSLAKCFLMLCQNLLYFRLCPLPFVLALGTTEKEHGFSLFASSPSYL